MGKEEGVKEVYFGAVLENCPYYGPHPWAHCPHHCERLDPRKWPCRKVDRQQVVESRKDRLSTALAVFQVLGREYSEGGVYVDNSDFWIVNRCYQLADKFLENA